MYLSFNIKKIIFSLSKYIVYLVYLARNILKVVLDKTATTKLTMRSYWITAEVIVIYCWELSSARLEEGHLFAPKLASIGQSPRLRQLRDNNAIYSIYKTFNQHQKAVFQRKLREVAVVVMWLEKNLILVKTSENGLHLLYFFFHNIHNYDLRLLLYLMRYKSIANPSVTKKISNLINVRDILYQGPPSWSLAEQMDLLKLFKM